MSGEVVKVKPSAGDELQSHGESDRNEGARRLSSSTIGREV